MLIPHAFVQMIKMNIKIVDNSILSFYSYPLGYLSKVGKKLNKES